METGPDNVRQFPARSCEEIAGRPIDLGQLGWDELITLERECADRVDDAQFELQVVQDQIGLRMRDGA